MAENIPPRPQRHAPSAAPRRPKAALPRPPVHLSAEARKIWGAIVKQWVIGDEALPTLRCGLEAFDLAQRCRLAVMGADLTTKTEGTGMIRINPLAKLQLDAMAEYRAAFRQLGLTPPEEG